MWSTGGWLRTVTAGLVLALVVAGGAATTGGYTGGDMAAAAVNSGGIPIEVRARGITGEELIELRVDGVVIDSWRLSVDFRDLSTTHVGSIAEGDIEVAFTNDGLGADGRSRDVQVDSITVDGIVHQTEDPDVLSTGTWVSGSGCVVDTPTGSEWLHCNGHFAYAVGPVHDGPTITIVARGRTGAEEIRVKADGNEVVAGHRLSTSMTAHQFPLDSIPEIVRVYFTNDGWTGQVNRDVQIDHIIIGDRTYESEDPSVYSQGSWTPDNGCEAGTKQSEWLHCNNAYFRYEIIDDSPPEFNRRIFFSVDTMDDDWRLQAADQSREFVTVRDDHVECTAGGFADDVGTHFARIRRDLDLVEGFTAQGPMAIASDFELPSDFYDRQDAYMRILTLDNYRFPMYRSETTPGANDDDEWRVGFLLYSDQRFRLVSDHQNNGHITLWTADQQLPTGRHTVRVEFTPSQTTDGSWSLYIDNQLVGSATGVQTVPSTLEPNEVAVTSIGGCIDGAASQDRQSVTMRVYSIEFEAAT